VRYWIVHILSGFARDSTTCLWISFVLHVCKALEVFCWMGFRPRSKSWNGRRPCIASSDLAKKGERTYLLGVMPAPTAHILRSTCNCSIPFSFAERPTMRNEHELRSGILASTCRACLLCVEVGSHLYPCTFPVANR
jgi:hypothetical protein